MSGGAEVLVEELDRQLKKRGFKSDIIYLPFKWYPKQELVNSALTWRMIDLSEYDGVKIDRVICTKFPSYVVNHPNKITWLFHQHRPAYDLYGTEYSDFQNTIDDQKYLQQIKNLDNITLGESKKIFTISKNVTNRLKKYNDIDSEVIYPPTKYEGRYYSNKYGDYIFTASRLESLKRIDLIIEAMKYTKSSAKLIIAGRGKYENQLKSMAKKFRLESKIVFKGYVDDNELLDLYANCMAVFFAPLDEDYGFITIEAFKSMKPVITADDSGGVLEFVDNEKTGFITDTDPVNIAKIVDSLYANKEKCKVMGEAAYKKVENINWDEVIKKLTAEY